MKYFFSVLIIFTSLLNLFSQDSLVTHNKIKTIVLAETVTYSAGMTGLYLLWYKGNGLGKFRFFNDNVQWKQVDKVGHAFTAFQVSNYSSQLYAWGGLSNKKAVFWGAVTGFLFQTPIEILDGFSPDYGASWGDVVANGLGSATFFLQAKLSNKIIIMPKFSFHRSSYAQYRSSVLGGSFVEQALKDYNGQTYWLSISSAHIFKKENILKYVNIAFGYGADGMVYARNHDNKNAGYSASRQWYLSLDWNLREIETNKKVIRVLLNTLNILKMPSPSLRFEQGKWQFLSIYT